MNYFAKPICIFIFIIGIVSFLTIEINAAPMAGIITLKPSQGPKGCDIKVSGSGFVHGGTVTIQYVRNGIQYPPDTLVTADAKGKITNAVIHAQGDFNNISYEVKAIDNVASPVSAPFTQTAKAKAPTDVTPKSRNSEAEFVGNNGDVVGEQDVDNSDLLFSNAPATIVSRAFVLRGGVLVPLGTLGGSGSAASAFNKKGLIVGAAQIAGDTETHAVVFNKDGTLKDLGNFGGKTSFALAINDRGKIVGVSYFAGDTSFHAFLYSVGQLHDLGSLGGSSSIARAINKRRDIVGTSLISGDTATHAFLISGSMKDLGTLGGSNSFGEGINNNGDATGYSNPTGSSDSHAFLYSNAHMIDLGTLGGKNSQGLAINSFGDVVGTAQTRKGAYHAVLYYVGRTLDLNDLLPNHSGWVLISANSINDNGQIAGLGKYKRKKKAFLLNLVSDTP